MRKSSAKRSGSLSAVARGQVAEAAGRQQQRQSDDPKQRRPLTPWPAIASEGCTGLCPELNILHITGVQTNRDVHRCGRVSDGDGRANVVISVGNLGETVAL